MFPVNTVYPSLLLIRYFQMMILMMMMMMISFWLAKYKIPVIVLAHYDTKQIVVANCNKTGLNGCQEVSNIWNILPVLVN